VRSTETRELTLSSTIGLNHRSDQTVSLKRR